MKINALLFVLLFIAAIAFAINEHYITAFVFMFYSGMEFGLMAAKMMVKMQ